MASVGCLPDGNKALYLQIFLYFSCSILGFFVCIPVGITLRNFHGSCILNAEIVLWNQAIIWPWTEPNCVYILYTNLAVNIFYATFMGLLYLLINLKKSIEYNRSLGKLMDWHISFILSAFNPIFIFINFFLLLLMVASASALTAGLSQFCRLTTNYINALPDKSVLGLSKNSSYACSELGSERAFWAQLPIVRGTTFGTHGNSFYGCLVVACIAAWLLFLLWLTQFALNVLMSCRICSCEIAEEKKKGDKTAIIAARRSRLATPIATPGGFVTPNGSRGVLNGPPPQAMTKDQLQQQQGQPLLPGYMQGEPIKQSQLAVPQLQHQPQYNNNQPGSRYADNSSSSFEKKPIPSSFTPASSDHNATMTPPHNQSFGSGANAPLPTPKSKQVFKKNAPGNGSSGAARRI